MITSAFENVRVAINQQWSNKMRALLTMLGIIIGIASVVILLSLGQAVQTYITGQFEGLGASLIRVSSLSNNNPLTMSEVEALADPARVSAASNVMPQTTGNYAVVYEGSEFNVSVQGITTDYLVVNDRSLSTGRFFTEQEQDASTLTAIIGVTTADNLFGASVDPLNKPIRIGSAIFQVIGVLNDTGGENDDVVLVPIASAQARLNATRTLTGTPVVNTILVKAVSNETVTDATTQITRVLREEHNLAAADADDFRVFTSTTILDSLSTIISTLTVFLGVLAGISLVVGGIGVMNIMLVTVNERTREIGLRKAVGAQQWDIIFQFMIEAVVLTIIGGLIGIGIAIGGASLITSLVEDFAVTVQPSSIALAVAISFSVGVFFGVYPASRAARLNPIDALRYE